MPVIEQSQIEILNEAAREATSAAPVIKNLLGSAAAALQKGNMQEAHDLLVPTITCLNFISQIIETLEESMGDRMSELRINDMDVVSVQAKWVARLEELKESINNNDMLRTADLLAYDVPSEFDYQVAILKKLAEGNV